MKRIILIVVVIVVIVLGGIGFYIWKNQQTTSTEDNTWDTSEEIWQEDTETDYSGPQDYLTPWEFLTWKGPDADNDTLESRSQRFLDKHLAWYRENPEYSDYSMIGSILDYLNPSFAIEIFNRADHWDRPTKNDFFINNIASYIGRKNDLLLSFYARFRPVIFRLFTYEDYGNYKIGYYISLLKEAYVEYSYNGVFDDEMMSDIYNRLTEENDLYDQMSLMFDKYGLTFPNADEDEYQGRSDIAWAYSFWPRRANEKNYRAVKAILDDLESHYEYDMDTAVPESAITNEILPEEDGNTIYQTTYPDGSLYCLYRYNEQAQRSGIWMLYYTDGSREECLMRNDGIEDWHKEYNEDGTLIRLNTFVNDTIVSREEYSETGEVTGRYSYIKGMRSGVSFSKSESGAITQTSWENNKLNGPSIINYANGMVKEENNYTDGKKDGVSKKYFQSGQLQEEAHYSKGELNGRKQVFHENGNLHWKTDYINGKSQDRYEEYYPSGQLKSDIMFDNGQLHGFRKTFYENGKLQTESEWKNGLSHGDFKSYYESGKINRIYRSENGKVEGPEKVYHENGELLSEVNWVKGMKQGPYKAYHPSGKIKTKGAYVNDKASGTWNNYYEDGMPETEIIYVNGSREGDYKSYHPNGKLKILSRLKNDKIDGIRKTFHENEQMESEAVYVSGKMQGPAKLFFLSGTVRETVDYENGQMEGTRTLYYPEGQIKWEAPYTKGKCNGEYRKYYPTGELQETVNYVNNQRHGPYKEFYPSGEIKQEVNYFYDKFEGELVIHDESGKVLSRTTYRNGEEIK